MGVIITPTTEASYRVSLVVAVSRYFLADKLVTHITIEQFLPQKKPRHYEHVVLNVTLTFLPRTGQ